MNPNVFKLAIGILQAANEQEVIVSAGDHASSSVNFLLGRFRRFGNRAPPFAIFRCCIRHLVKCTLYQRMLTLERDTITHAQICRSDEEKVHSFNGGNRIHTIDCLSIFNLNDKKGFTIPFLKKVEGVSQ